MEWDGKPEKTLSPGVLPEWKEYEGIHVSLGALYRHQCSVITHTLTHAHTHHSLFGGPGVLTYVITDPTHREVTKCFAWQSLAL